MPEPGKNQAWHKQKTSPPVLKAVGLAAVQSTQEARNVRLHRSSSASWAKLLGRRPAEGPDNRAWLPASVAWPLRQLSPALCWKEREHWLHSHAVNLYIYFWTFIFNVILRENQINHFLNIEWKSRFHFIFIHSHSKKPFLFPSSIYSFQQMSGKQ